MKNADEPTKIILEKLLRYHPGGYWFTWLYKSHRWDGYNYLFKRNQNSFPTGLLSRVIEKLKQQFIPYEIVDLRKIPSKEFDFQKKIKLPEIREYQLEAVNSFLKEHRGVINIPTGTGKTRIAVEIIEKLGLRTLFVCPSILILKQTEELLSNLFGKKNVGIYFGEEKNIVKPIIVASVDSLDSFPKELCKFDLLILDEFHSAGAPTYTNLNKSHFNGIYYRLGLTATHFRHDPSQMAMDSVLENAIYTMSIKKAIQNNFLCEPYFFCYEFFHDRYEYGNYPKSYKHMITGNLKRNQLVAKVGRYCQRKNLQTLILVDHIQHGLNLKELIPEAIFLQGNSKNKDDVLESFKKGKTKFIIATDIMNEGVDIPNLQAIIIAGALKAEGDFIQKIGRALRKYPGKEKAFIFDIADRRCKYFKGQSEKRQKIYKKNYTGKISVIIQQKS